MYYQHLHFNDQTKKPNKIRKTTSTEFCTVFVVRLTTTPPPPAAPPFLTIRRVKWAF